MFRLLSGWFDLNFFRSLLQEENTLKTRWRRVPPVRMLSMIADEGEISDSNTDMDRTEEVQKKEKKSAWLTVPDSNSDKVFYLNGVGQVVGAQVTEL